MRRARSSRIGLRDSRLFTDINLPARVARNAGGSRVSSFLAPARTRDDVHTRAPFLRLYERYTRWRVYADLRISNDVSFYTTLPRARNSFISDLFGLQFIFARAHLFRHLTRANARAIYRLFIRCGDRIDSSDTRYRFDMRLTHRNELREEKSQYSTINRGSRKNNKFYFAPF